MHSIREMCGTDDVVLSVRHFTAFFKEFNAIDTTLDVDSLPQAHIMGTIQDTPCEHV